MAIKTFSSTIRRREMDAVLTCMVEEKIGPGDLNARLTQLVKDTFSLSGAVALRSPSIALSWALDMLSLDSGSGVILSPFAPSWHVNCVKSCGLIPIVVDVSPETGLIIPETVKKGIEKGGRVIVLHESLGQVPNMNPLLELNIPIIEDISQNAGANLGESFVGSYGVFSIIGLEENDILTAGGGAILAAPKKRDWAVLNEKLEKACITDILPDINSALAWVQLKELRRNENLRKEMYEMYVRSLMQGRHTTFSTTEEYAIPAVYSFPVILSSGFKDVESYAKKKDIEIIRAFEKAIIEHYPQLCEDCVQASSLSLRCALFPLYPRLGLKKADKVSKILATLP